MCGRTQHPGNGGEATCSDIIGLGQVAWLSILRSDQLLWQFLFPLPLSVIYFNTILALSP